ncbi:MULTISPECIES: hypothetical protein [unclassified Mesorhizobium]|uniref:hypothetical protein n=1 Tax=unclassified Mesorhizobium TaxID=325217 RepID=UPI000FD56437|nr:MULTISPECIES: hypothetical protein [unclassified Mesorhizobium]RUV97767.1 hypothetical protein EOA88_01100 [Mesorhizobium sp. M5C.F.Ca.IN.020.14.1.1]RUV31529.1 hypothetical protein EOA86_06225 [Mesorhizobium sp. M5C.F.Ca.IN.020.32.2.1]RWD52824.1 MAG: hypothetical protein EOS59_02240 [Mesorhizobium sp.]RWE63366.1 MAG: hypothetical protein EOS24_03265 [Mesorhizobium sp.]RWF11227.1 MAG: hypothetical protein EOS69_10045 [Mesorhizobium sp.]
MQIAPIGALEATLANLTTSIASQQQITAGTAAQPGNRMVGANQEKHDAAKVTMPERGDVATRAGQQVAQASSGASPAMAGQSSKLERTEPVAEHKLFDYLAEVEKAGGGAFEDPSALFGSAVQSLEGTMQQVQKAIGQANVPANAETAAMQDGAGKAAPSAKEGENATAKNAEQLLERSISVMWAAANLEVVTSSVTAVTSSASTLIKQQ